MDSRSSFSLLEKLVPLSERMSLTWPLLAMNLLSANRKESVSKLCATSMCTARMAKHVKITLSSELYPAARRLLQLRAPNENCDLFERYETRLPLEDCAVNFAMTIKQISRLVASPALSSELYPSARR